MPRGYARWDERQLQGRRWDALDPVREHSPLVGGENDGINTFLGDNGFSNANWLTSQATKTANTALAPDGTMTAASLVENTANDRHILYYGVTGISMLAAGRYVFSVYAKNVSRRYMQLLMANGNGTGSKCSAYFDLQDGLVTDTDLISSALEIRAGITPAANGFWKCSAVWRLAANVTSVYCQIGMSNVATYGAPLNFDSPSYTGTSSRIDVWRPRLTLL